MKIQITLFLIISFMLSFVNNCKIWQTKIVIPKSEIQKELDKIFPVKNNNLIIGITIDSAIVYFKDKNIGLKTCYGGFFLNKELKGIADFNGQLIYHNDDGSFYLSNIRLVNVSVNNEKLLSQEQLRSLISILINKSLEKTPLYRLDQNEYKQVIAKLLLKDVKTEDEKLILTFGI